MSDKSRHYTSFADQKIELKREYQFLKCRNTMKNVSGFITQAWNRMRQGADYKPNRYKKMPDDESVVVLCPKCKKRCTGNFVLQL